MEFRRGGFTQIELLVVVSIVATLLPAIGLSAPVMGRAICTLADVMPIRQERNHP